MSDLPEIDWFMVKDRAITETLRKIIGRKRRDGEVNTYTGPKQDKAGKTIFTLGYDDRPDSDWGRYIGHKMIVRLLDPDLAPCVEDAIRSGLGWQALAQGEKA